jgi:hypothetical protein
LRWAINAAEQQPGRDTIEFDIAPAPPRPDRIGSGARRMPSCLRRTPRRHQR